MKRKEVLDKAYGSAAREVGLNPSLEFDIVRGFRYHYLKLIRFFKRR